MKRKIIIGSVIVVYIIAIISMYNIVDKYVHNKVHSLRAEIQQELDNIYGNNYRVIDVEYSNAPIKPEKVPMPQKNKIVNPNPVIPSLNREIRKIEDQEYESYFGDLKSLYKVSYLLGSDSRLFNCCWCLKIMYKSSDGFSLQELFPYGVGYKKILDFYQTSVEDAVKDAFDFYTKNKKSQYSNSIEIGSYKRIYSQITNLSNEYYYINRAVDSTIVLKFFRPFFGEIKEPNLYTPLNCSRESYMYNNEYKVFVGTTPQISFYIDRIDEEQDSKEIASLRSLWGVLLTILMLLIVVPLTLMEIRYQKRIKETLYVKLKRLCNPSKFVTEYDKEKVDKANAIYQKLMNTSPDDKDTLYDLQSQAEDVLGVSFVDPEMVEELKKKVNPKRFMKPYNPEKVTLANELYSRLSQKNISYKEIIEIEEKSKIL